MNLTNRVNACYACVMVQCSGSTLPLLGPGSVECRPAFTQQVPGDRGRIIWLRSGVSTILSIIIQWTVHIGCKREQLVSKLEGFFNFRSEGVTDVCWGADGRTKDGNSVYGMLDFTVLGKEGGYGRVRAICFTFAGIEEESQRLELVLKPEASAFLSMLAWISKEGQQYLHCPHRQ
jgi:hypothetical protein